MEIIDQPVAILCTRAHLRAISSILNPYINSPRISACVIWKIFYLYTSSWARGVMAFYEFDVQRWVRYKRVLSVSSHKPSAPKGLTTTSMTKQHLALSSAHTVASRATDLFPKSAQIQAQEAGNPASCITTLGPGTDCPINRLTNQAQVQRRSAAATSVTRDY